QWQRRGNRCQRRNQQSERICDRHADGPAGHSQGGALGKKLLENVTPARAKTLTYANLFGALRDRNQHYVHDDDSADDESYRGNTNRHRLNCPKDLLPEIIDCPWRNYAEIVLLAGREPAPSPHDYARFINRIE